jgi:hypothetical protein
VDKAKRGNQQKPETCRCSASQDAVDAGAGDTELVGDCGRRQTGFVKLVYGSWIDGAGPALVAAGGLCPRNALGLALTAKVRFELGEDAQHVQKAFAGGSRHVDRLLSRAQRYTLAFARNYARSARCVG